MSRAATHVLAGRGEAEHLYCERCAKVTVVAPADLDPVREQIHERFGYTPRFTHFAIVGLCNECAARAADALTTGPDQLHSHGDYVHSHSHRGAHSHPG